MLRDGAVRRRVARSEARGLMNRRRLPIHAEGNWGRGAVWNRLADSWGLGNLVGSGSVVIAHRVFLKMLQARPKGERACGVLDWAVVVSASSDYLSTTMALAHLSEKLCLLGLLPMVTPIAMVMPREINDPMIGMMFVTVEIRYHELRTNEAP